jgi:hypothetical protein
MQTGDVEVDVYKSVDRDPRIDLASKRPFKRTLDRADEGAAERAEFEGGRIFVSYRRQETSHLAGRLYDRLADRFGKSQVFIDVDAIATGVDFAKEIFRAVAACKVLLAIIGPTWLTVAGQRGRRRLDDPGDIVRLEVETALASGVPVIPILVEGAAMPTRQDLPESLAGLARRNALLIRHESFGHDAGRLVTAIERVLGAPGTVAEPPHAHDTDPRWDIEMPWGVSFGDHGRVLMGDATDEGFGELADPEEDGLGDEPLAESDDSDLFDAPEASSASPEAGDADLSP